MEVKILGAARQVGRSAVLVSHNGTKVLLDYGALTTRIPGFPIHVQPKEVSAIILSHAHLDHSGALPIYFLRKKIKLHCTPVTSELSNILIQDFIKISGQYLPFEYVDLLSMNSNTVYHGYKEDFEIESIRVTLYDAGHIPGSSIIVLEAGSKRLVYTGDINSEETNLLRPADSKLGEADMVITESTYATSDHPERIKVEREFTEFAKEVVERGGILLVPAFSVGRAQEIAMTLYKNGFRYPVAMDGMALKVNTVLLRYQEYLRDPDLLRRTIENIEEVSGWSQRRKIVKRPGVIISPAGMLVGGAAIFYNERVAMGEKNAIAIVSFQVPGTPGRTLLEKGLTIHNGKTVKAKAELRRFDFSSHSGRTRLVSMLKSIKGNPVFVTVHGDEEACVSLAEQLKNEVGAYAVAPSPGQEFSV
jgi:putative mRNA 3-end processing factor